MNTRLQDRLIESEILKIFDDVAQGVACMHYLQPPLLHRDIKVRILLAKTCAESRSKTFSSLLLGVTSSVILAPLHNLVPQANQRQNAVPSKKTFRNIQHYNTDPPKWSMSTVVCPSMRRAISGLWEFCYINYVIIRRRLRIRVILRF